MPSIGAPPRIARPARAVLQWAPDSEAAVSLTGNILDNLYCFSRAMYATWYWFKPSRMLWDCGEGVATALGNRAFAIEQVIFTHGHYDHLGGLPSLILTRAGAMGDKEKPLAIHYPDGDRMVEAMRRYIESAFAHIRFELSWLPYPTGAEIPVRGMGDEAPRTTGDKFVRPFRVRHSRSLPAHGLALIESRNRLKPAFEGLPGQKIAELVRAHGRDHITERYQQRLLCFSGDAMPVAVEDVHRAQVLIHEATFLKAAHRKEPLHATVEEALGVAIEAEVGCLVLSHFSSRYAFMDYERAYRKLIKARAPAFPVYLAPFDLERPFEFLPLWQPEGPEAGVSPNAQAEESPVRRS